MLEELVSRGKKMFQKFQILKAKPHTAEPNDQSHLQFHVHWSHKLRDPVQWKTQAK